MQNRIQAYLKGTKKLNIQVLRKRYTKYIFIHIIYLSIVKYYKKKRVDIKRWIVGKYEYMQN